MNLCLGQPVIIHLMAFSAWADITNQRFDPSEMLKEFPMTLTHVDEFVRAMVENNRII